MLWVPRMKQIILKFLPLLPACCAKVLASMSESFEGAKRFLMTRPVIGHQSQVGQITCHQVSFRPLPFTYTQLPRGRTNLFQSTGNISSAKMAKNRGEMDNLSTFKTSSPTGGTSVCSVRCQNNSFNSFHAANQWKKRDGAVDEEK